MARKVTGIAKNLHYAYSLGASIVILGALFKITHIQIGFLTGNVVLGIGLITEALIFVLAAFYDVPNEEVNWEKVYPELADSQAVAKKSTTNLFADEAKIDSLLTEKFNKMLAEAKIDAELFNKLKSSLDGFSSNIADMANVSDGLKSTQAYSDQMNVATNHLSSLNAIYNLQIENGKTYSEYSKSLIENLKGVQEESMKLEKDLLGLSTNIKELNKIYGGMLTAMRNKE